ncbi:hypothetical protein ACSBR2_034751 [Camellia fascicularis]
MASNQTAEVSVRILIDEAKNRVVCAEAGNDFVDILFSFLTLPMGTIVRLIRNQQSSQESQIGCMNSLYRSVENLGTSYLQTDACKDMLLHPRTPLEIICRGLKVNIDDTKPTKYFICSDSACKYKLLSNYVNTKCKCGKLLNREIYASGSGSNANATDEVFVKQSTAYIVGDNLQVMVSTPVALVELLGNVGIKDVNSLKEKVVKVGSEQILNLLKHSLLSESPLTDVFLPNERFNSKRRKLLEQRDHQFISQNIPGANTNGSMAVKIIVRKSDGKALCAEAMEDFVDLLFSFLTIPLANVLKCLDGKSSLGCVDNLYKSLQVLNNKWFVTHKMPSRMYCGYAHQSSHDLLLNPGLGPKFRCSSQPFQLEERNANYYCHSKLLGVCSLTFERPSINSGEAVTDLILIDPKTSNWETDSEKFVKRPTVFLVSDGLVVQPSVSTTSSISYLKGLDVPIEDIEEHVLKINNQEALNLLKAALITTSALTNALNLPSSRNTKQEL